MRQAGPLVMAIDVGGTKTAIVATREMPVDGLVPAGGTAVFPTPHDPDRFVDAVEGSVGDVVPTGERVVAVGIGAPGPVDVERGFIASSPNIGWRDVPIGELVTRRLGGVPVAMEDDSNAGALGEAVAGAGRGIDPYVYLPLGTGLGAGIIVGGQVLHGVGGAAGEVGHMALDRRDGPRCSCGRRNCIETWCAGAGLAKRAREVWPSERSADGSLAPRDAEAVFALAESGDPDAIELVGRARHALATAIAVILASVAPAAVTIGGSIGLSQPAFVRSAFEEATELVDRSTGSRAKLREPQLGGESVITGAAVLGLRAVS
jgi:glucokinase